MREVYQGEVFWFERPIFGSAPGERHPCVVVQSDMFNRSRISTAVVCVITSNESRTRSPGNVLVKKGEANLLRDSVVNITQVATVDKSELVERIGKLSAGTVDAIREGLHLLFDRM